MTPILTPEEYAAFEAAEALIYRGYAWSYAWSAVRDRGDSEALAALFADAVSGLEVLADDPDGADAEYVLGEAARRVAAAQFYVMFGELPKEKEES